MNIRKIALASVTAALIALPFLVFGGDLQIGNAIPWGSSTPVSMGCDWITCR